jgi:hypothetical protein
MFFFFSSYRDPVQVSIGLLPAMAKEFRDFPQQLQANENIIPLQRPQPLPINCYLVTVNALADTFRHCYFQVSLLRGHTGIDFVGGYTIKTAQWRYYNFNIRHPRWYADTKIYLLLSVLFLSWPDDGSLS